MAGGSKRLDLEEEGVSITIDQDVFDPEEIPRGCTFVPEYFPAAAPEMSFPSFKGHF